MELAVIRTGGKQYLITPGQKLKIEKLPQAVGDEVVFDQVLLLQDKGQIEVGQPLVKTPIKAKVISQGRGPKIYIIKHRPKTRYHKKAGHRQSLTEVQIEG